MRGGASATTAGPGAGRIRCTHGTREKEAGRHRSSIWGTELRIHHRRLTKSRRRQYLVYRSGGTEHHRDSRAHIALRLNLSRLGQQAGQG